MSLLGSIGAVILAPTSSLEVTMMKRHRHPLRSLGPCVLAASIALVALAPGALAAPKLRADYRFEGNLKSSVGSAPKLVREGPGASFVTKRVKGVRQRVWQWPEGTGLRLNEARKALGPGPGTYTFVILIRLDRVDSYRKLIHFKDLDEDNGFYVDDGTLYAYPTKYSDDVVSAKVWYQIVVTRNSNGIVMGYVDGTRVLRLADKDEDQVLGPNAFLRFVRDDESTEDEESGGMIARLRVYNDALSPKQVRRLDL